MAAQIQQFAAVLSNRNAALQDWRDALKFLVHFGGDIHQPCTVKIIMVTEVAITSISPTFTGQRGVIEQALHVRLGPNFTPDLSVTAAEAANLNQAISNSDVAAWAPDGLAANLGAATVQWANESHALARTAYQNLPPVRQPGWDQTYQDPAWKIIQEQLARGGV